MLDQNRLFLLNVVSNACTWFHGDILTIIEQLSEAMLFGCPTVLPRLT